jgi:UDP-N-acetylglucosamine 2-epimerase (non-hydrolysing)
MRPLAVVNVVGARPNFVKIAPLMAAMRADPAFEPRLVNTGQHYDREMAQLFLEELGIPEPEVNFGVGSSSPAQQTADIMVRFERLLNERRPDLVLVVGDVNSTFACAVTATRLGVKVAHVEAGLRSFDWTMPEELNRKLTDHVSDFLFVTEPSGVENLRNEGINSNSVMQVGNVMIDTLMRCRRRAARSDVRERLGVAEGDYAVLTAHRPSSVDDRAAFERILLAVEEIQRRLPVIFPVHPRTRRRMEVWGLGSRLSEAKGLRLVEPLGYIDFMRLLQDARLVLTDSGGVQEETCIHGAPCIVLRENTERPVTLGSGFHALVGTNTEKILEYAERYLAVARPGPFLVPLWDGHASERIAAALRERADEIREAP